METGKILSISKVRLVRYSKYNKWVPILIIFLILNGFNYLINDNIQKFIAPSQTVFDDLNSLMRGENRLIEGYLDLKQQYYLNTSNFTPEFFDQVTFHLDSAGK